MGNESDLFRCKDQERGKKCVHSDRTHQNYGFKRLLTPVHTQCCANTYSTSVWMLLLEVQRIIKFSDKNLKNTYSLSVSHVTMWNTLLTVMKTLCQSKARCVTFAAAQKWDSLQKAHEQRELQTRPALLAEPPPSDNITAMVHPLSRECKTWPSRMSFPFPATLSHWRATTSVSC